MYTTMRHASVARIALTGGAAQSVLSGIVVLAQRAQHPHPLHCLGRKLAAAAHTSVSTNGSFIIVQL